MNQIKKKTEERIPSFQPRARKYLFILFLCLPLAMLAPPLSACVDPDISNGYSASRAPNQLTADLQDAPTLYLLARGGGGGGGGGRGQGKGGGDGSGQCDGSGSGQGKGKGYGAKDGAGTGDRPQDGSGYGAGSGKGSQDGSGKGSGKGSGRSNQ